MTDGAVPGPATTSGLESESGTADRLIFFSDAVVAIAMTLLALDLPVPSGADVHEFWNSIQDNSTEYLAFVISFTVIGNMWGRHHHAFRFLARSDSTIRTLNMAWLFTIVINPFATKLLTYESGDTLVVHALRWDFYALLQVLSTTTFLLMVRHMLGGGLAAEHTPPGLARDSLRHSIGILVGFGLSIPVFFATPYAWLLWAVVPLLFGWLGRTGRVQWLRPDTVGADPL